MSLAFGMFSVAPGLPWRSRLGVRREAKHHAAFPRTICAHECQHPRRTLKAVSRYACHRTPRLPLTRIRPKKRVRQKRSRPCGWLGTFTLRQGDGHIVRTKGIVVDVSRAVNGKEAARRIDVVMLREVARAPTTRRHGRQLLLRGHVFASVLHRATPRRAARLRPTSKAPARESRRET